MPETPETGGDFRYDVAVIIINYNSSRFTLQAVDSVRQHTPASCRYQVVVVDNNSRAEEEEPLVALTAFPEVTLVRSKLNVGFAGGNMLGVQAAQAEFLFFLNNDCVLLNDCLGLLSDYCRRYPQVGLCTGQMYNADGSFHPSFGYFPSPQTKWLGVGLLRLFRPERYPLRKRQYQEPLQVELVTGSAMFVRAAVFAQFGGFDTNYFLYCEEEDLAQQVRRAGYQVYVVPVASFIHFGGSSTVRNLAVEREFYISLFYYFRKFHGPLAVGVLQLFYLFKNLRKFYRGTHFLHLAGFILRGAPMKQSLRFSQQVRFRDQPFVENGGGAFRSAAGG